MIMDSGINRLLARYPAVAAGGYVVLVLLLVFFACYAVADLYDQNQAVSAANDLLAQLDRSRPASASGVAASGDMPQGSPFLEGQTVTVAGAALLQRVASAVTRVGGNVLSSQVDVQGIQSNSGLVTLTASCEVTQEDLQKLLYDLEAGMPYLFVDQLAVQAPDTLSRSEGGRLRIVLGVSGQWQGSK
jgi:general secretion pathway protein M